MSKKCGLVDIDEETGAIYYTFSDCRITKTISITDEIMIDMDANGHPVGLEDLTWLHFPEAS